MVGYSAVIDGPAIVSIYPPLPPPPTAPLPPPTPSFLHRCINLHAIFQKEAQKKQNKTSNGNVLKNDSQYPLAIEARNFPLLNTAGEIDAESRREGGGEREGGREELRQAGDVPALLSLLTFIAARL